MNERFYRACVARLRAVGGRLADSRQSGDVQRLRRSDGEGDSHPGGGTSPFWQRGLIAEDLQRGGGRRSPDCGGQLQRGGLVACRRLLPAVRQHGHDAVGHRAPADLLPRYRLSTVRKQL